MPARSEIGAHRQHKAEEVNEFLSNLEGCAERQVVIAATNEPEKVDDRGSGRFDKLILIPPPQPDEPCRTFISVIALLIYCSIRSVLPL